MELRPDILIKSGEYFNFLEPENNVFTVEDIAHGLSNICRFGGHTAAFYSVAQHSVIASHLVPRELAYEALFHDAAEAFLGDIPKPLKAILPDFQAIEKRVEAAVFGFLGINPTEAKSGIVKEADLVMLASEDRDLMPTHEDEWVLIKGVKPINVIIAPLSPSQAYFVFMRRYDQVRPGAPKTDGQKLVEFVDRMMGY